MTRPSGAALHEFSTGRRGGDASTLTSRKGTGSATKIASTLLVFALLTDPAVPLRLESTTGDVLGWTGTKGRISVAMLGNFVSGLNIEASKACIFPDAGEPEERASLAECVEFIGRLGTVSAPGRDFEYGAAHWYVLARMAEVAAGEDWNTLFERRIKEPLGLSAPDLTFAQWVFDIGGGSGAYEYTVAQPRGDRPVLTGFALRNDAPNPAAGLLATPAELMAILSLVSGRGRLADGTRLIDEDLIAGMSRVNFPAARVEGDDLFDAVRRFRYRAGFGTILFCGRSGRAWSRQPRCDVFGQYSATGSTVWTWTGAYNACVNGESPTGGQGMAYELLLMRDAIDDGIAGVVSRL